MTGFVDDGTRDITYFDFNSPETRERLELWLSHTRSMIKMKCALSEKDLEKISELFLILEKKGTYTIPRKRGERHVPTKSYEKLVCWYRVALETQKGMSATQAKKETAERFLVSLKTIEAYSTKHRDTIERFINKVGFEDSFDTYGRFLPFFKGKREKHFIES